VTGVKAQKTVIRPEDLVVTSDVDAGWEIRGDILECWGNDTNGIITLPAGLEYANTNYTVTAIVTPLSTHGDATSNTGWPMSWRTIGRIV